MERVKVISIGKRDGFYHNRKSIIGKSGIVKEKYHWGGGWFGCDIIFDDPIKLSNSKDFSFFYVKFKYINP